ncbi:MAG: DUF1349 domain-containing protein [Nibricoccus sp.]
MTKVSQLSLFFWCSVVVASVLSAAEPLLHLNGLPGELTVVNAPAAIHTDAAGTTLYLEAPAKTNLYNHPNGRSTALTAPMVLFETDTEFFLKVRVTGKLKNVYDVAALVIYQDSNTWAKLCYEYSMMNEPTIVSVVTRGVSDDCNSQYIDADSVYLAIVRRGPVFAFHYSLDGKLWRMVRHFNLKTGGKLKAGLAVHASRGDGFAATFSEIAYSDKPPANMIDLNAPTK